jgi:putative NIF3 family GTP cyclohydrolase 1 type 2
MTRRLRPSGGYRRTDSYQTATIVCDATYWFCEKFLDSRSRTVDQMVQAARSGRQNIAEGKGATTFLSGEAIHFGKLYARESGMNLILAGHYETELPAVQALLERVASGCGVETQLIRDETSAGL